MRWQMKTATTVSEYDLEATAPELARLRELARATRATTDRPIGTLIGVPDCGVCVVEVRLGADIDGGLLWLYRADATGGQWIEFPGGDVEYVRVKEQLREILPMHVCVWWEGEGEYRWEDT